MQRLCTAVMGDVKHAIRGRGSGFVDVGHEMVVVVVAENDLGVIFKEVDLQRKKETVKC